MIRHDITALRDVLRGRIQQVGGFTSQDAKSIALDLLDEVESLRWRLSTAEKAKEGIQEERNRYFGELRIRIERLEKERDDLRAEDTKRRSELTREREENTRLRLVNNLDVLDDYERKFQQIRDLVALDPTRLVHQQQSGPCPICGGTRVVCQCKRKQTMTLEHQVTLLRNLVQGLHPEHTCAASPGPLESCNGCIWIMHRDEALKQTQEGFDFKTWLERRETWSLKAFGPGKRTPGIIKHIQSELEEVAHDPSDTEEWIDLIFLALDGAAREGASPEKIIETLLAKTVKNETRKWRDPSTLSPGEPSYHLEDARANLCPECENEGYVEVKKFEKCPKGCPTPKMGE